MEHENQSEEMFLKYRIVTYPQGKGFVVRVYNTNRKGYRAQVSIYGYGFRTEEERQEWINDFKKRITEWEEMKSDRRKNRKNEVTGVVKKALANKYGYSNVSVYRGSGTAYGWVHANIELDPIECPDHSDNWDTRCTCKKARREEEQKATEFVYAAMKAAGERFYTYSSDDGYGSEHDEFMLRVGYKS